MFFFKKTCWQSFRLGKTILVPLTNSLYVPGKLSDPEHVIVDVGTGYYVQKVRCTTFILLLTPLIFAFPNQTRAQALKHYSTKVDYIRTNLEALEDTIQKKRENMNYLVNILQSKIQTQTQQGGPQGWTFETIGFMLWDIHVLMKKRHSYANLIHKRQWHWHK